MKNNLSISVCMTVFSHSKYLKKQLYSIINQSIKINELIIVEDYSGEKSPRQYIESICSRENIKLLYKECKKNFGPAECFRKAILVSSSDVIVLSDHDDIWLKDRILKALRLHQNNDLIVINGQITETKSNSTSIGKTKNKKIYHDLKFNLMNLIIKNKIIGSTISLRGDTARFIASKISFYPMHDWILAISFLILNKKIKFLDECLIIYQRHDDTFTGNKKNSFIKKCKYRLFILFTICRVFTLK